MASAVRTLKTLRPHIPLIKFPKRRTAPAYDPAVTTQISAAHKTSDNKPIGASSRGSGIDEASLPKKYQRKPLSVEEMEYIERGGPS